MAADPIVYCLQELTDYEQFERLCHDMMGEYGYSPIEPLGGSKDKGRDAIYISNATGETTLFAYSVREDWRKKLFEDAGKVRSHNHQCEKLVFVTTSALTANDRDVAKAEILSGFGWTLDIYSLERLRTLLASTQKHLIAKHPQIFTPSFFPSQATAPKGDLMINVSPTRMRRQQLVQMGVFNRGDAPVYLSGWYADYASPETATVSVRCMEGEFPHRLIEQDAARFLIDLGEYAVERLTGLGVIDAENKRWGAGEAALRTFIRTAIEHRPPLPARHGQTAEAIAAASVEINATRVRRTSKADQLLVTFKNLSELEIRLRGARLEWKFDVEESELGAQSTPRVQEAGGSVSLRLHNSDTVVRPNGASEFLLSDDLADVVLAVLKPKLIESSVRICIVSESGVAWGFTDEALTNNVKALAESILATW